MIKETYIYDAVVKKVIDGDTLDLEIDLGFNTWIYERIRLYDVDTPEIFGRNASEAGAHAKMFVIDWLPIDFKVTIDSRKYDPRGKYGRVLADIYKPNDETSLNDALREAGFDKAQSN